MKIKNFYISFIAAAITLSSFVPVLPPEVLPRVLETKVVRAAEDQPNWFQVSVKDHNCSDQTGSSSLAGPNGSAAATDSNAKDPDCGNISFNTSSVSGVGLTETIYNNDFRIGTRLAESESGCSRDAGAIRWTPWASEGGGAGWGATANPNVNDPDCLWIHYETRPLPAGILIQDVRAGISTGHGGFAFTPWARQGGGSSSYSGGGNISPARLFLDVRLVDVYDADYVSDTIPASMNRGQSGDYEIVMKNKATTWQTDFPSYAQTDECSSQQPEDVQEGETCAAVVQGHSTKIKLNSLNSITGIRTTPEPELEYRREIVREYVAADVCISFDGSFAGPSGGGLEGGGDEGIKGGFLTPLIKTAQALRLPDDIEPGDTGPYCNEWGYMFALVSQTPTNMNIVNEDDGSFPISVQIEPTATNGTHTLQYQMVNLDTNELFGEIANIDISIGAGLTCGADVIVPVGTEAQYAIAATGTPSAPLSVTMSSAPTGPTMINNPPVQNNPLVLNSGNSFTGTAYVATTGLTAGSYTLTFTGDNGSSCQSNLNVIAPDPLVDIDFNNLDGPVVLGVGVTSGTLSWTSENVASCIASTNPGANSINPQWNDSTIISLPDGSLAVSNITPGILYTFTLSCTNSSGGSVSDSVQVSTTAVVPPVPTANIQCQGSVRGITEGPCGIGYGESGTIFWSSTDATACSIDNGIGSGLQPNNTSPGVSTGNLYSTTTFTITCSGPGGTSAPDSVVFDVPTVQPSFTLTCTPASISLPQGSTGSFDLETTGLYGFADRVDFSNTDISPRPDTAPGITFDNNGQVPDAVTTALVDTSGATPGIFTLTFEGTGGGNTESCSVELEITSINPPTVDIAVTASNANCGTIDISWKNPGGSPDPGSFRVYHRLTTKDPWVQIGEKDTTYDPSGSYVVTHSDSPPLSLDSSNYYAVTALFSGVESEYVIADPASIIPQTCAPNTSRSDKDVLSVAGQINKTFNAVACSGVSEIASLPNNAVFAPGDRVTFQINVCNSGAGTLTGVSVLDTLKNLSGVTDISSPQGCINNQNYDEKSGTISFDLADIGPGDVSTQSCSIVFTATVTAPEAATGALYRFQNIANITTNELAQYQVLTPPYLFSLTGGVPDRTETAPN